MHDIFIDTETTGLKGILVQISITDHTQILFNSYVNPGMRIPIDATRIHGISNHDVIDAPSFSDIRNDVQKIVTEAKNIWFYNAEFDVAVIKRHCNKLGIPHIDFTDGKRNKIRDAMIEWSEFANEVASVRVNRELIQRPRWWKLVDVAEHIGHEYRAHGAIADCFTTAAAVRIMRKAREIGGDKVELDDIEIVKDADGRYLSIHSNKIRAGM